MYTSDLTPRFDSLDPTLLTLLPVASDDDDDWEVEEWERQDDDWEEEEDDDDWDEEDDLIDEFEDDWQEDDIELESRFAGKVRPPRGIGIPKRNPPSSPTPDRKAKRTPIRKRMSKDLRVDDDDGLDS